MISRFVVGVITALVSAATPALAEGPFGFEMGQSLSSLGNCARDGKYYYKCSVAPSSHRSFESYQLIETEKTGVCAVIGVGKTVNTGANGFDFKSEFDRVAGQLQMNYGEPVKNDFLMRGSIWREPNDWMMGIAKKDRIYSYVWLVARGAKLKNKINAISLTANALSSDKGYLGLRYEFQNFAECSKAMKDNEAGAL